MSEPYADLTFRTLEPGDEDADAALLRGWLEGLARGFHDGRNDQAEFDRWRKHAGRDGAVVRGAWPTARVADGTLPVGTFASWAGELNVGGARTLGLHMISDVTVAPTHRRRGLLRRLMTEDLDHAVAQGRPLAALTATEGSIYGRFGFGPAVRGRRVEIDTGPRFGLRHLDDPGSLEMAEPTEAWPHVREVFERHLGRTRGAVSRPSFYEMFLTGEYDWDKGAPDKMLRAVLHLDPAGTVDGYALFKHNGDHRKDAAVELVDLAADTTAAYLRLWRFVADIDLVEKVRWGRSPLLDVLEVALVDPRVVTTTALHDTLWVRVLDLPVALEARPWSADADVVLEVEDDLGHTAGRWRVTTSGGAATVRRTDDAADVRLSAETLGHLYLGDVDVAPLVAVGRVTGAAAGTFAAMADGGPTPWCTTGF